MIRIHRPPAAPRVLVEEGVARSQEHEAHLGAGGAERLTFDRDTYAHASVKRAVRQSDADPLEAPGYYWLAYEWTNLLFSCERCNRRHKKNLFPLLDPSRRARARTAPLSSEAPVFVDPTVDDPARHISFREHVPIAIAGDTRGERTIEALGLRRAALNADREKHLATLRTLHAVAANAVVPADLRARTRSLLLRAVAPEAEYSLMCRVALAALGGIPPAPDSAPEPAAPEPAAPEPAAPEPAAPAPAVPEPGAPEPAA